jgi:hypothetical protein
MPYENIGISTSLAPESRSSPTGLVMLYYLLPDPPPLSTLAKAPSDPKMKTPSGSKGVLVCDLAFIILSALLSILYVVGFVLALWIAPPLLMKIVWTI